MSYHATIHELKTGRFLLQCQVEAHDIHDAEDAALQKASSAMSVVPCDMEVRHLHECAQRRTLEPELLAA